MNRMSGFCLVTMVSYVVVACGSAALGHGHGSTHPAASHPPAAHHPAPKSGAKPNAEKHSAGKSKEPHHDEKKPKGVASAAKSHDKSHEHHDEHHHHDAHHHEHGDHEWVGGTVIGNGVSVDGTPGAAVTGGDGVPSAAVVPSVVPTGIANRPQIQFSVDPAERDSYEAAAQAAGMSRSDWIRTRLNAAAGRELK